MEIKNIIQHYPESEKSFIIKVLNMIESVDLNYTTRSIGFCNPAQVNIFLELKAHFPEVNYLIDGGYNNAERRKIIIFPSFFEIEDSEIKMYQIKYNKKFQTLKHNQVLGALLNDGYNINQIGDIVISDDIYLIVDKTIAESIIYSISSFSSIKVSFIEVDEIIGEKEVLPIKKKYVKSLRIDAVVKIITNESREKSKIYFAKKYVQYNYMVVEDMTINVEKNGIISIRGFGRITITNIIKSTKGYYIEYR